MTTDAVLRVAAKNEGAAYAATYDLDVLDIAFGTASI
jgi:hypothetical protein